MEYLQAHGIQSVIPPLRSSDYSTCLSNPFAYYMARRLGVVPLLRWSKALNRGTWMHLRFQNFALGAARALTMGEKLLDDRLEELRQICKELGIQGDGLRSILEREEKDMRCSFGWYEAAKIIPCYDGMSFEDFLLSPHWHRLGTEFRLITSVRTDDRARPIKCTAQPDLLLYHKGQNSLWIVDLKTTAISPRMRLTAVPIEFQVEHYMFSVQSLLDTGQLQNAFNLPSDCRLGGMMHLAIRKPAIEFGMKDRDFSLDTSPFKSGPRKGEPRNEKKFLGEPNLNNYIERCTSWYKATGDYKDKEAEWAEDPPVNISFTAGSLVLDENIQRRYRDRIRLVQHFAICDPHPVNFPMSDRVLSRAELSTYAPFMLSPVKDWPELIQSEGFAIRRRDDPIPEDIEFDVLTEPGSEFEEE